jgi:hypothetical protein
MYVFGCRKMNETGDHHVKWNKSVSKDKYLMFSHMWNIWVGKIHESKRDYYGCYEFRGGKGKE